MVLIFTKATCRIRHYSVSFIHKIPILLLQDIAALIEHHTLHRGNIILEV